MCSACLQFVGCKYDKRKNFLYVDNEGRNFCLIRGKSDNPIVDTIAGIFAEIATHVCTICWISRVSSFSNIADGPSRGDVQTVKRLGFRDVSNEVHACLKSLCLSVQTKLGSSDNIGEDG